MKRKKIKSTKVLARIKPDKFLVLALVLIFILALGVRLGLIFHSESASPRPMMSVWEGELARNLVEGRGYVVDEEYIDTVNNLQRPKHQLIDLEDVPPPEDEQFTPYYALVPGTSALLAGTFWISGEYRYIYLRVIQAIIDSFGCLLMFLIGRELFSKRIGLVAAFLYAVFLPIANQSTWILHDALMPFMVLLSLYFFVKAVRNNSIKFYIISALVIGISCYFQPSTQLLPLFFGLGLFIYSLRKTKFRENVVNVVKVTVIMMAVLLLVVSPWIARNYRVTGSVMTMRPGPWQGIWEGFGEFENPVGAVLDDKLTYEQIRKEVGYDIEPHSPEYQAVLKTKVLNAIKEHPGWWLSVLARRAPRTIVYVSNLGIQQHLPRDDEGNLLSAEWESQERTLNDFKTAITSGKIWEFIKIHPYNTFYWTLAALFATVPVLLGIVGIWVMRRRWRELILVATVPAYFSVVHIFTLVSGVSKSMLPGSLAYIIFSAIAIDYIYGRIKDARGRKK